MSHINEALRKAQKDRDAHALKYTGILSSGKAQKRTFWSKALFWGALFLILLLLVFTSYSWWDSRGKKILAPSDKKVLAKRPPLAKSAGRAKSSQPKGVGSPRGPSQKTAANESGSPQKAARSARAFYEKAVRFHKRDRLQDAKRFYQEALRLDPGYVDALNNLGVIYIRDREYTAAQRNFERAVRLRPGYVDAHYNLACLHAIKGEVTQSLAHLKKAVSLDESARDWARKDTDLQNLRGLSEFKAITGG
ncbi:MAG: tetratricopeptide repeat protein [Desulfobacteraceae bacterium]|jgi:tetratricopeptide (TPR) repeat protein